MICKLATNVRDGLEAAEVAQALGTLEGYHRSRALVCLEPHIAPGLTGDGLARILGSELRYRETMICRIKAHARPGLDASELTSTLDGLQGYGRSAAVACLEPRIAIGLTGQDLARILDRELRFRQTIICRLKNHARVGFDADEAAVVLGDLQGYERSAAVVCLERRMKFGLGGGELSRVLGSETRFRANMICRLAPHARPDLSVDEMVQVLGALAGNDRATAIGCLSRTPSASGTSSSVTSAGSPPGSAQSLRPTISSVTPRSADGANCPRPFDLQGTGFSPGMNVVVSWTGPAAAGTNTKMLPVGQVAISDARNSRITINTLEDAADWTIKIGSATSGYSDPANFKVTVKSVGDVIGAFGGVSALSSGDKTGTLNAIHQCVEYAKAYYLKNMPAVTEVNSTWMSAAAFWNRPAYSSLSRRKNGSTTVPPRPGDLIFFSTGHAEGHVAVVKSTTGGRVEIVQQNIARNTAYAWLPVTIDRVTGLVSVGSKMTLQPSDCTKTFPVLGWLSPSAGTTMPASAGTAETGASGTVAVAPAPAGGQSPDPASAFFQSLQKGDMPSWHAIADVGSLLKDVTGFNQITDDALRSQLRKKAGGNWVYSTVVDAFIDVIVDEMDKHGAFGSVCPFGIFCDKYVMKSYLITAKNMTVVDIPAQVWDQGWLIAESWQETKEAFDALPCFYSLSAADQASMKDLYWFKKLIGSPDPPGCQGSW